MLLVILKHVHAYEVGGTRQPQAGQSPSLRFVCQFRPSRAPPQDKDADQQADSNVLCMHKNPAASVLVSWIGLVRCDDGSIFQFVRSTDVQAGLACSTEGRAARTAKFDPDWRQLFAGLVGQVTPFRSLGCFLPAT